MRSTRGLEGVWGREEGVWGREQASLHVGGRVRVVGVGGTEACHGDGLTNIAFNAVVEHDQHTRAQDIVDAENSSTENKLSGDGLQHAAYPA